VLSIGDLELRRIGGRDLLAPFFASYGSPANSDYAPFLDLHAAKHRFLQTHASELTGLGASGVPVAAMLEGRARDWTVQPSLEGAAHFDKIDGLRRAYYALGFALGKPRTDAFEIPAALQKDLEIVRRRPVDCSSPDRFNLWFNSLFQVSRAVAPLLPSAQAAAASDALTDLACAARLPAAQDAWVRLLRAVARRDAPAMAALAERLLDPGLAHSPSQRQYLLMAAMTGNLVLGRHDKARAMWSEHGRDADVDSDLSFRLLRAHAFPKPGAPAP
jgi:spermidine synthase